MFCKKCNAPLNDGDVFCKNCGEKVENNDNQTMDFEPVKIGEESVDSNPMNNSPVVDNNDVFNQPFMNNNQDSNPMNNMNNGPMLNNNDMYNQPFMNNNQDSNVMNNMNNANMNNGPMLNNNMPNQPFMNNNGMNYQQYNNPNFNPMYNQQPSSNKNGIFAIVGSIILIGVIVVVVILLTSKSGNNANNNYKPTNDTKSTPTPVVKNTYTISLNGFSFDIPIEYKYTPGKNSFVIMDNNETWMSNISLADVTFEQAKIAKDKIADNLRQEGYTIKDYSVKNVSNTELIIYNASMGGYNNVIAYGKLNASHCYGIAIISMDNNISNSLLSKVVEVAKSGKISSASNSIATNVFDSTASEYIMNLE